MDGTAEQERHLEVFALDPAVLSAHHDRHSIEARIKKLPRQASEHLRHALREAAKHKEIVLALADTAAGDDLLHLARHHDPSCHAVDALGDAVRAATLAAGADVATVRYWTGLRKRDEAVLLKRARKLNLADHTTAAEAPTYAGVLWEFDVRKTPGQEARNPHQHLQHLLAGVLAWSVEVGGLSAADAEDPAFRRLIETLPQCGHCWHGGAHIRADTNFSDSGSGDWLRLHLSCEVDLPRVHKWLLVTLEFKATASATDVAEAAKGGNITETNRFLPAHVMIAMRDPAWRRDAQRPDRAAADKLLEPIAIHVLPPKSVATIHFGLIQDQCLPVDMSQKAASDAAFAFIRGRLAAAALHDSQQDTKAALHAQHAAETAAADIKTNLQLEVDAARASIERYRERLALAERALEDARTKTSPPPAASQPSIDSDAAQALERERQANAALTTRTAFLTEELDEMRAEIWRINQWLSTRTAAEPGAAMARQPLTKLAHLETWAKNNLLGMRVILTSRALRAAEKSVFENTTLVADSLGALADWYWPMVFQGDPEAKAQWLRFLEANHLRCGPTGEALNHHHTAETYRVTHAGRRLDLDRHLQGQSNRNLTRQFRLYYACDEEARALIIGHLPSHLPNRQT